MRGPILTKAQMYAALVAGDFGNTVPQWFTIREWQDRAILRNQRLWGVRHATLGGFLGTRLNVETNDVPKVIEEGRFGKDYQISPMISEWGKVVWEGNIERQTDGLFAEGHLYPEPGSWRRHMLHPQQWHGVSALALLNLVLNENSMDDLRILLDEYPDHVIELSAMEGCWGTVPGRNAIIWEVRLY